MVVGIETGKCVADWSHCVAGWCEWAVGRAVGRDGRPGGQPDKRAVGRAAGGRASWRADGRAVGPQAAGLGACVRDKLMRTLNYNSISTTCAPHDHRRVAVAESAAGRLLDSRGIVTTVAHRAVTDVAAAFAAKWH